jgi:transcription initiation factor TFIIIB Brf1 subunit/transcription initiation factor TFIIB
MDQLDLELEKFENISDESLLDLMSSIDFDEVEESPIEEKSKGVCENCKGQDTMFEDYSNGILVCKECGQVNDNIMDSNPEWRNYDGSSSKARCSSTTNPMLPKSSLGTSIGGYSRSKVKTLHEWDSMPYDERSLHIVLREIKNRCQKNNILKCIEDDAKIMYKFVSECRHKTGSNKGKKFIIRGANRRSLIAACVFFACRKKGYTRSPKEIAKIFELNFTDTTKGLKTFTRLLKLRNDINMSLGKSTSEDFVPRFCRDLNIKKKYIAIAQQIARNIDSLNIASKHTPISIASGSIMLMIEMNGLTITKKALSEKFDVSEVTISKSYKTIEKYRDILIDDEKVNIILKNMQKERENNELPQNLKKKLETNNKKSNDDDKSLISEDTYSTISFESCKIEDDLDEFCDSINIDLCDKIAYTESTYEDLILNA